MLKRKKIQNIQLICDIDSEKNIANIFDSAANMKLAFVEQERPLCTLLQLRPSKTADSLIYAIKRPIFDSLWLIPEKCYAIFFANPNRYRLDLSKEISDSSVGQWAAKLIVLKTYPCGGIKTGI